MPAPNGLWIQTALRIAAKLARLPKQAQAEVLAAQAANLNITPATLRRNLSAAQYCASHAKGAGLKVTEVAAAALSVELLMRLERRDRAAANRIRRGVLEGSISAQAMQDRLRSLPAQPTNARGLSEWENVALSVIEVSYSEPPASFSRAENSEIGKLLRVDIEVWIGTAELPDAIFISAMDGFSESFGLTLEDQLPFVLAACVMYPHVILALHARSDFNRIAALISAAGRELPKNLAAVLVPPEDD